MSSTPEVPAGPVRRRKGPIVVAIVVTVVALGLLYLLLRNVDFAQVLRSVRTARPVPLVAAVVIATLTFGVRALRWRWLLRGPDDRPIPLLALWHATAIGFMANNTLPISRMGELVRAFAGARLGGVPFTTAFASLAVERALDGLTVIALMAIGLFGAGLPAEQEIAGVRLDTVAVRAGVLCVVILLLALLTVLFPLAAERVVRAIVPAPRLADRVVGLIEAVRRGFGALTSPSRLGWAVALSVVHWTMNGLAFYVAFAAFDIPVGVAGALLVQGLLVIGITAPSTPGYFGVFELVVTAALALFGVSEAVAFAYGLTFHVTTFIPIILLGLWSLARTPISLRDVTRPAA